MAEARRRTKEKSIVDEPEDEEGAAPSPDALRAEDSERSLARYVAWGLPAATVAGASATGAVSGIGPGILVLAGGTVLITIAFFWASIRTLSGDAPVAEALTRRTLSSTRSDDAEARKRTFLRALKDLELEHAIGKIDDADFSALTQSYRAQAKAVMRELDGRTEPMRERAEEIARRHMEKRGVLARGAAAEGRTPPMEGESRPIRVECVSCQASNEPDARFCKKCGGTLGAGS